MPEIGYGYNQKAFEQQGEDEVVSGFCDRCCRNRRLARYHRQAPPPVRFTALCGTCLMEMSALLLIGSANGEV